MNEREDNAKYGECRCCFTMGNHRDLMKEYEWNGTREVYFKIFLDCFNVFLSKKPGKSNLICTSCVLKLRDATSFKNMVLEAERTLSSSEIKQEESVTGALDQSEVSPMIVVEIKNEPVESSDVEHNDGDLDSDSMPEQEDADAAIEFKQSSHPVASKQQSDKNKKDKLAYIYNTTLIIQNSSVTPFRPRYHNGFACLYCSTPFKDLPELQTHQQKHTVSELNTTLSSLGAEAFIVYVDVTDLQCTICYEQIPNLTELKSHLITKHKKKMQDCSDRIVPFKLTPNSFECQLCKCKFETFGVMERHMNVHFRNYVCTECGTGFVTKYRLKVHFKQLHNEGSFQCETCKKVYATRLKLKNHIDFAHEKTKRTKCTLCDQFFVNYLIKTNHMAEVHGETKPEFKCNVCNKIFNAKYLLSRHMRRDHLEQKNYQCEVCSYTCYYKYELKHHMIKHNGSRIFDCSVCKKSYARMKTLREHMKIHNNDRRFACQACGQAFVQNRSLKRHIKTHHPELLVYSFVALN